MSTIRDRVLSVYRGGTPDRVPFMLDLSHWFYHKNQLPWDLSQAYTEPEYQLIDYHKKNGIGFYMPNLAAFYQAEYEDDVKSRVAKTSTGGSLQITWSYECPLGRIDRMRVWDEQTYSWHTHDWGINNERDVAILAYALSRRTFTSDWTDYQNWKDYVGDDGVVYVSSGYSAMGYLMNYWMGPENAIFATYDYSDVMREAVDTINENNLQLIDLLAQSSADVIVMGDNFSSDLQPPSLYNEWSRDYYSEAIRRLHDAGKYVAVHIDGRLAGAIAMIRDTGADCADAVTPFPLGDLKAAQCREEAGPDFILSGGVSPDLWLPDVGIEQFEKAVMDWLELKEISPRLIANAGDQVPPGAEEERIFIMKELVEEYGRY